MLKLAADERFVPRQVCKQFTEAGIMADADLDSSCLLNKKIRNAQLAQYNFILGKNSPSQPFQWCFSFFTSKISLVFNVLNVCLYVINMVFKTAC